MAQTCSISDASLAVHADASIQRLEKALVWTLLVGVFVLRIVYAIHYRMDSDEPQHLYVARGWAHGLMQYRDVFDNHTPLFHMICAPLVGAIGDRVELLIWMRLAMLPLFGLTLLAVYWIGQALFSPRLGLWAAVWIAVLRPFFATSAEFRADDLWMALWLLSIAVLVRPLLTMWRSALAGLLLGAALGASLKTGLLTPCLLASAVVAVVVVARGCPLGSLLSKLARSAVAGAVGAAIVPGSIILYFAAKGALGPLKYGTIEHNSILGFGSPLDRWPLLVGSLAMAVVGSWGAWRPEAPSSLTARRLFVVLLASFSLGALAFWPMLTPQSYLAVYPLLGVPVLAIVEKIVPLVLRRSSGRTRPAAPQVAWLATVSTVAMIQLVILTACAPWHTHLSGPMRMWRDVLRLSDPGQKVMDLKGELLFRPRAYYYMLESVADLRFERGLITDDIPEQLVKSRTCVASPGRKRLPPGAYAFLRDNYIPVGSLLVAGKRLEDPLVPAGSQAKFPDRQVIRFNVAVPARYGIISEASGKPVAGLLDDQPCQGPRFLDAGPHEYRPASGEVDLVLIWAQALERGFRPRDLSLAD